MTPYDLKAWRISLCLSQQRAADELGMSRYGYQQLENGTTVIAKILDTAKNLGYPIGES